MRARAARVLEAVGCDAFVASDPFTVAWLTGFAADETWGPNPFAVAPLAVVRSDGSVVAIVSEDEAPALEGSGCEVVAYEGFTMGPLDIFAARRAALASLGLRGRVAVEDGALPVPGVEAVQADAHALRLLRAVKDDDEIARIRAAIRICDAGQAAARNALRAGVSELEAWGTVQAAMQVAAGERLSLLCDFATGDRSAETGGPPAPRVVATASSRSSTSSRAWPATSGTPARRSPWATCRRRSARRTRAAPTRSSPASRRSPRVWWPAISMRSCARASTTRTTAATASASRRTRSRASCRAARRCWRPGMVVALEPGTYPGPWGMRVERVALVTDAGCEVLSTHDLSL